MSPDADGTDGNNKLQKAILPIRKFSNEINLSSSIRYWGIEIGKLESLVSTRESPLGGISFKSFVVN